MERRKGSEELEKIERNQITTAKVFLPPDERQNSLLGRADGTALVVLIDDLVERNWIVVYNSFPWICYTELSKILHIFM